VSLFKAASTVSLLTLASASPALVRDVLMVSVSASAPDRRLLRRLPHPQPVPPVFGEGAFSQAFVPVLAGQQGAKRATRRQSC
jgi:putative peptidoglycan lipid II flippase